mmetsp:Transcript_2447/g.4536  ORF Transcript_2447/g.4536 Transcript_2447/m.4536 type:complete len:220 (-) Transcript_2447:1777-2436(-)
MLLCKVTKCNLHVVQVEFALTLHIGFVKGFFQLSGGRIVLVSATSLRSSSRSALATLCPAEKRKKTSGCCRPLLEEFPKTVLIPGCQAHLGFCNNWATLQVSQLGRTLQNSTRTDLHHSLCLRFGGQRADLLWRGRSSAISSEDDEKLSVVLGRSSSRKVHPAEACLKKFAKFSDREPMCLKALHVQQSLVGGKILGRRAFVHLSHHVQATDTQEHQKR